MIGFWVTWDLQTSPPLNMGIRPYLPLRVAVRLKINIYAWRALEVIRAKHGELCVAGTDLRSRL